MLAAHQAVDVVSMDKLFPALETTINSFQEVSVSKERMVIIRKIAQSLIDLMAKGETPNLMFVCTHNSRRSQLAEAWSHAFAFKYNLSSISCSGGTEATSFVENAVKALQTIGFQLEGNEAMRLLRVGEKSSPTKMYSKTWDNALNPQKNLVAIMVCSDAEENCPFIPGAVARIALPFEDPKRFDGTENVQEAYKQAALLIGSEIHTLYTLITNS